MSRGQLVQGIKADGTFVPIAVDASGKLLTSGGGVTIDTDPTLSANSDSVVASQKATKAYVNTTAGAYLPLAGGVITGGVVSRTIRPSTSITDNLGSSTNYYYSVLAQRHYFNSTAYLDGSTAGVVALTGNFDIPVSSATTGQVTQGGSTLIHTYQGAGATANANIFIGRSSGNFTSNSSGPTYEGSANIGLGEQTLQSLTTGFYNVAIGTRAGQDLTTGQGNFFVGHQAGQNVTTGTYDFFMGRDSGVAATSGSTNIGIGRNTLASVTTTSNNVAIGSYAGNSTTGSANVFIGSEAGRNETGSNKLYIANSNTSAPLIGGDFSANTLTTPASIEITDSTKGIILKSPNGTRYRVTVADDGSLTTAAA